jgi:hypothetical protein
MRSLLLLFFLVSLLLPHSVAAVEEFSVSVVSTHTFSESGTSQVLQNFSITNLTSSSYLDSFTITFSEGVPEDITATDTKPLTIKQIDSHTLHIAGFTRPALGLGSTQKFSLGFSGPSAIHTGQVWQLVIPQLEKPSSYQKFTTTIVYPAAWGTPTKTSSPPSRFIDISPSNHKLEFPKSAISSSQLTVFVGHVATISFDLTYPSAQTLIIPSDSSTQRIFYKSITPLPKNVTQDVHANWQAIFDPIPKDPIRLTGLVNLFSQPLEQTDSSQTIYGLDIAINKPSNWSSLKPSLDQKHFALSFVIPPTEIIKSTFSQAAYEVFSDVDPGSRLYLPETFFPFLSDQFIWSISNSSGFARYLESPIANSSIPIASVSKVPTILPPYSTVDFYYKFARFPLFPTSHVPITINSNYDTQSYNIPVSYFLSWKVVICVVSSISIIIVSLLAYKAWSIYLQICRRSHYLRRQGKLVARPS